MSKLLTYELSGWRGLDTQPNLADKDPHFLEDCQNIDFDDRGVIAKRRGVLQNSTYSGRINMIYDFQSQIGFENSSDKQRVLIAHGEILTLVTGWGGGSQTTSDTFDITNAIHYACSSNNGVCYISNENSGVPKMLAYVNGSWVFQSAELDAPAAAPTLAVGDTGSLTGSFQAIYSYNDIFGNESNPSDESDSIDLAENVLNVGVVASSDPTIESISVYVLSPSYTTFKYVGTYSNTTGTISVSVSDAQIGGGDDAEYNRYPCPEGRYVRIFNDMLIAAGGDEIPDQVFCSNWRFHRQRCSASKRLWPVIL